MIWLSKLLEIVTIYAGNWNELQFNGAANQVPVGEPLWLSEIRVDSRLSLTGTVLSELYERLDVQLIELRVSEIGLYRAPLTPSRVSVPTGKCALCPAMSIRNWR